MAGTPEFRLAFRNSGWGFCSLVGATIDRSMTMEASKKWSAAWFLLISALVTASLSQAYAFYAGGRDGWVRSPSESYNHWAERNGFQVNDTIVFMYRKGVDPVLVVTEQDFDACNTSNSIRRLDGGYSVFQFDRCGPFFFIRGDQDRCQKGQKLYIVVMAIRTTEAAPAPASPLAFSPTPNAAFTPPSLASPPEYYAQAPGGNLGVGYDEQGARQFRGWGFRCGFGGFGILIGVCLQRKF